MPDPWSAFYHSDLQSPWLLLVLPALFLLYRAATGRRRGGALPAAAPFVDAYALLFAVQTMLDPIATGPLLRALGLADGSGGTAVMLLFVLLGDLRVYLLVFALLAIAAGRRWTSALPTAAAWTLAAPLIAYPLNAALQAASLRAAAPSLDANSIWLVYELVFVALALGMRARLVPARTPADAPRLHAYLRAVLAYVAVYYGLWASADVLIQFAGLDLGWLLRVVPNQLYYSAWVPFVFGRFFFAAAR